MEKPCGAIYLVQVAKGFVPDINLKPLRRCRNMWLKTGANGANVGVGVDPPPRRVVLPKILPRTATSLAQNKFTISSHLGKRVYINLPITRTQSFIEVGVKK